MTSTISQAFSPFIASAKKVKKLVKNHLIFVYKVYNLYSKNRLNDILMLNLEKSLCFRLMMVRRSVIEATKSDFKALNFTYDNYVMMIVISERPGITQSDLARILGRDKNVITRLIDKFEKDALLTRINGKDRRSYAIELTTKGEALLTKMHQLVLQTETEITQSLSGKERTRLIESLNTIILNTCPHVLESPIKDSQC